MKIYMYLQQLHQMDVDSGPHPNCVCAEFVHPLPVGGDLAGSVRHFRLSVLPNRR